MAIAFTKRSDNILAIGSFQAKTTVGKTGITAWNNITDIAKEIDNVEKITLAQIDEQNPSLP